MNPPQLLEKYDGSDFENVFHEPSQEEESDLYKHLTLSQAIYDDESDNDEGEISPQKNDNSKEIKKVSDQNNQNLINDDGAQKQKSKSLSSSGKKRQKISHYNQITLTQGCFISKGDPFSTRKSIEFKDTDDTAYLVVNGNIRRVFKINEAFTIRKKEGLVFVIQSFQSKLDKGRKKAKGLLFRKWNNTFVGNIKYACPFAKYVDDFNLNCDEYVKFEEEGQSFNLINLGDRLKGFDANHTSNNKILYTYSAPPKDKFGAASHGFTCSYRHSDKNQENSADEEFPEDIDWDHVDLKRIDALVAKKTPRKSQSSFEPTTATLQMIINQVEAQLGPSLQGVGIVNELYKVQYSLYKVQDSLKTKDSEINRLRNEIQSYNASKAGKRKPKIKVLDVFTGIGGMSCGLLKSGFFDVTHAVENNHRAAAIFRLNHPDTFVFEEDAKLFLEKVKTSNDGPYKDVLTCDHLHFSPPCQAFSCANPGGSNDDKNAALTLFCIDFIKYFYENGSMKSISMENVTGLLRPEKGIDNYMKCVMSSLFSMGMDVKLMVMDSKMYGDPQKRCRVFITAWKPDLRPMRFPQETHGINGKRFVTTSDVLKIYSQVAPTKGNGLVLIPSSDGTFQIVENHCIEGTELTADQKKIQADKPSHTIKRNNNIVHYKHNRRCTNRELATLMGFPPSFKLSGSHTDIINGLGNAVPVGLSTCFGIGIKEMHEG